MTDTAPIPLATVDQLRAVLRTDPIAEEGRQPTPREVMDWLDRQEQPIAEAYVRHLLRSELVAARCSYAEHDAYPAQVDRLCRQVVENLALAHRFRTAWESARRRAAGHRADLELLVGLTQDAPLALVLDEPTETVGWTEPHNHDLSLGRRINPNRLVSPCERYPDAEWVHTKGPCSELTPEAQPVEDTASHTRHTNDLRDPSVLIKTHPDGRPYFDQTRPWWLCHTTGLVHTEGPCVLRTNPLDLRAGTGPIDLTDRVRANLEGRHFEYHDTHPDDPCPSHPHHGHQQAPR